MRSSTVFSFVLCFFISCSLSYIKPIIVSKCLRKISFISLSDDFNVIEKNNDGVTLLSDGTELSDYTSMSTEGYVNSDISTLNDGKKLRVFFYIFLALIPCLVLVPFFMSREFVPPIDPEYIN
jgi:hypothetical protein